MRARTDPVRDHARALRIRERRIAEDVRRNHATAAATQREVLAAATGLLGGLLPATEGTERVVAIPVGSELVNGRPGRRRRREAAGRDHPTSLGADQKIASRAA